MRKTTTLKTIFRGFHDDGEKALNIGRDSWQKKGTPDFEKKMQIEIKWRTSGAPNFQSRIAIDRKLGTNSRATITIDNVPNCPSMSIHLFRPALKDAANHCWLEMRPHCRIDLGND